MVNHLVHALAEFRVLVRQEDRTHALVTRCPALATIVGAIEAGRRDRDAHALLVLRINDDRVQTQAAAPGHPLRTVLVVQQPVDCRPALAAIARLEQRSWLDTGKEAIRFVVAAWRDLPDLLERQLRLFREAHRLPLRP